MKIKTYYPKKSPQNCFDSANCSNKTGMQIPKFLLAVGKFKT